jgi:hypothetical protein
MKPPNRCAVFFEILLCAVSLASADVRNVLQLRPAPQVIHVDGAVDSSWCCADSAADFHQLMPYFGQPPKYRTVAKVLTSEDALYCLMICYQPSDEIETITGVHDEISGDVVSLMIDTFGDKQSAYKFAVSASGVQADCRLLDDARNRDCNWDGVWAGAAKTYTWGYVVEMQVPYRSIKYDALLQEWGLDFDRYVPSTREDLYWSSYEQNEGQRISKFGRLMLNGGGSRTGGLNLEVYPVGLAKGDYNPDGTYNTEARAGVDVFYNPSEQLTFQLTANPDFAQIEADPYEFNVSRYETYFSERRPFFVENSEIFMASGRQSNSGFYQPIELFYSRRIGKLLPDGTLVPLVVGAKASGRLSDWEYGGFYAFTGAENYQADGQGMTEPRASFASARNTVCRQENCVGCQWCDRHRWSPERPLMAALLSDRPLIPEFHRRFRRLSRSHHGYRRLAVYGPGQSHREELRCRPGGIRSLEGYGGRDRSHRPGLVLRRGRSAAAQPVRRPDRQL